MKRPTVGHPEQIDDGVRRILAPNPGPMTHWGTNTWIVGQGNVAVIDPGPVDSDHLDAILAATVGETITHILVTHPHADHSPLARKLRERSGAPISGYGAPHDGRSAVMERLSTRIDMGGGEGVDAHFKPDHHISEGDVVSGDNWALKVIHTPGHFSGHLSFRLGDVLFSGDHMMDWASTLVSPPDGDMAAFRATSQRLVEMGLQRCFSGHGSPINDPSGRISWLLAHRQSREDSILRALSSKPLSISDIMPAVYHDVPNPMHQVAARNVFAHLIDLWERKLIKAMPSLSHEAVYSIR